MGRCANINRSSSQQPPIRTSHCVNCPAPTACSLFWLLLLKCPILTLIPFGSSPSGLIPCSLCIDCSERKGHSLSNVFRATNLHNNPSHQLSIHSPFLRFQQHRAGAEVVLALNVWNVFKCHHCSSSRATLDTIVHGWAVDKGIRMQKERGQKNHHDLMGQLWHWDERPSPTLGLAIWALSTPWECSERETKSAQHLPARTEKEGGGVLECRVIPFSAHSDAFSRQLTVSDQIQLPPFWILPLWQSQP